MGGAVNSILGGATDLVGGVLGGASDLIESGADVVQQNPLTAAALIAAGYYFAPEIGAWTTGAEESQIIPGTQAGEYGAAPVTTGAVTNLETPALNPDQSLIDAYGGGAAAAAAPEVAASVAPEAIAPEVAASVAPEAIAGNADKAALLGGAGYGAGMTGAETAAYDTALGAGAGVAAGGATNNLLTGAAAAGGLSNMLVPGAILGSSLIGANAASSAADTQAAATDRANQVALDIFNQQKALQAPYREAGITAQNRLMELLGLGGNTAAEGYGSANKPFTYSDLTASPDYQFRLGEGLKALDRQAAMRGGLISGGAIKAAQTYGQDQASQEYTNAFNRYQTNRTNMLQPLSNLITSGQNAAANTGTAAANYGTTAGNNITSGAAATAAGNVGTANAITGGVGQYLNYNTNNNLLNVLAQQRQSAYTG